MATTLTARPREERGKNAARKMRRAGMVPAVMYGHGDEPRALSVDLHELQRLLATTRVETTILDIQVEGAATVPALVREVQYHPARPEILHLDLLMVHAGEKLHLVVPVRLQGTPTGVSEDAGILQEVLRELSVECLPRDIPEAIDIDISELAAGSSIYVREVSVPRVTILNDPDLVICTVGHPTVAELPETAETADGVGGEVEPELIRSHREDAKDVPFERGSAQPE
jgi:large subunit ribosomal protein L25